MPGPRFLAGDRVSLHVVGDDDQDFLQRHWNHPEVRPGFGNPGPVSSDDMADRVASMVDSDEEEILLVCADSTDDPTTDGRDTSPERVGEAFVFDCQPARGRAEIGYWIAPAHQGNGYATETAELLVDYLVTERRLHKINARVLAFNDGSRRVLEKLGFEHEGRRRDDFHVDGEYVDGDLYGLLAEEWDGPAEAPSRERVD